MDGRDRSSGSTLRPLTCLPPPWPQECVPQRPRYKISLLLVSQQIKNAALSSDSNAVRLSFRDRRRTSIVRVFAFPILTHATLGGGPRRKLSWWKSESFDTMMKSFRRANSQTDRSSASLAQLLEREWILGTHWRDPPRGGRRDSRRRGASLGRCVEELPFAISGECKDGSDVLRFEVRDICENLSLCHSGRQIVQNLINGNSKATDAGLPASLARVDGDALLVVHAKRYPPPGMSVNHAAACQSQTAPVVWVRT